MKKIIALCIVVLAFSCSKSDDNNQQAESRYPKTVDVRFEANPAINNESFVITNVDTSVESHELVDNGDFPFAFTILNKTVNLGSVAKIRYTDDTAVSSGPTGPWTNYEIEVKIFVDDVQVATEMLEITQDEPTVVFQYTFI